VQARSLQATAIGVPVKACKTRIRVAYQLPRFPVLSRPPAPLVETHHLRRTEGGPLRFCAPLAQLLGRLARDRAERGDKSIVDLRIAPRRVDAALHDSACFPGMRFQLPRLAELTHSLAAPREAG
jgi:hypothetical protein